MKKLNIRMINVFCTLNAPREAVVYIPDNGTLIGKLKKSMLHLFSPAKALADIGFIVTSVPSKWYMSILSARMHAQTLIEFADEGDQLYALRNMQLHLTEAIRNKTFGIRINPDWRLSFGIIDLFVVLLKHHKLHAKAKLQVLTGTTEFGEQLFGLESFLQFSHWIRKARASWIREAAIEALGQLANQPELWVDPQLKSALASYLEVRSACAVEVSEEQVKVSEWTQLPRPSHDFTPSASSKYTDATPQSTRATPTRRSFASQPSGTE